MNGSPGITLAPLDACYDVWNGYLHTVITLILMLLGWLAGTVLAE